MSSGNNNFLNTKIDLKEATKKANLHDTMPYFLEKLKEIPSNKESIKNRKKGIRYKADPLMQKPEKIIIKEVGVYTDKYGYQVQYLLTKDNYILTGHSERGIYQTKKECQNYIDKYNKLYENKA